MALPSSEEEAMALPSSEEDAMALLSDEDAAAERGVPEDEPFGGIDSTSPVEEGEPFG